MTDKSEYSDEDHDIDIESDIDDSSSLNGNFSLSEADKKAHHNALERKRRDHIKESFTRLRDAIPDTKKEKTSRALILKRATDYIRFLSSKRCNVQKEIDSIRKRTNILRQQVEAAERARANGAFVAIPQSFRNSSESSDNEAEFPATNSNSRNKRLKIKN